MAVRYAYETPDPDRPGELKTVVVDVPAEIACGEPAAREAFYQQHLALYPAPPKPEEAE